MSLIFGVPRLVHWTVSVSIISSPVLQVKILALILDDAILVMLVQNIW